MFFDDECKNIITRIVQAYDLNTIKSLCDKWDMSAGVMASRIQRNTFPYDYVVRCSLETGANLLWLCTGQGEAGIDGDQPVKKEVVLSDEFLEKLERLTALKEKGSITEQEFNLLKSNLI